MHSKLLATTILMVSIGISMQTQFGWGNGNAWQGAGQNWQQFIPNRQVPQGAIPEDNTCEKLPCNFNNGQTCGYELSDPNVLNPTALVSTALGSWYQSGKVPTNLVLQAGSLGDGEGKLPPDGGFVVCQGPVGGRLGTYMFRSPAYVAGLNDRLIFKYQGHAPGTALSVCTKGRANCKVAIQMPKDALTNWQEIEMQLPPGNNQLEFVVRDLGALLWIAIDNIKIKKGGTMC